MKTVEYLLNESINTDLCCHCGACAGVCPVGAVTVQQNCLSINPEKCVDCGLCTQVCPAKGYVLSDLTCEDIWELPKFSAGAKDPNVSQDASSGGFVTQTLLSLLEEGEITAAAVVVTGDDLMEPSSKYIVTSSPENILAARRSKYTQASIDEVLEYIKHNDGRYAVVGLPCQLYAITMAMERLPVLRNRIAYKIGMVCGYTYDESCVDGLLKVLGTTRDATESILGWREGGLPGNFSVKLKDGKILSMPFVDEHSVDVTYFAQNRCLLCKDCLCEYGDVVCADIGGWSERKTLVMVRTAQGQKLIGKLETFGKLLIEPCDIPFEKTVLPFMLREKRSKVDIRIFHYKNQDRSVTTFIGGYAPKLLLAQKVEAVQSIKLQRIARKNRDAHSRERMLKLGHKSYHKISKRFSLKVLFKLQVYHRALSSRFFKLMKKISGKMKEMLPAAVFKCQKPLRIVVIGLGRWGSQYLSILKKSRKYNLVAAFDNDREKLEKYSSKFGFLTSGSIADLCNSYGAEAVFVLTPTLTHKDIFAELCAYSLPVYMEKPIASTLAETLDMVDAANENNVLLYVAHSMKYEPAIRKVKEILSSGALGTITNIRLVRTVKSRNDIYYPHAALYQIGVHLIDVLLYLTGSSNCDSLRKYSQGNVDSVCFKQGDATVKLRYGFGEVYNFSLYISGEKGHVLLSDGVLKTIIDGKESYYKIPMRNEKTLSYQLDEFYDAIRDGKPYLNTKETAAEIVSLCHKIAEIGECL